MLKAGNKGIVLFVVIMTVVMAIILGTVVLSTMLTQNRFSHHKVSRIQAYYAGLAGLRYASEMLRQYSLNPSNLVYKAWIPEEQTPPVPDTVCALLCRTSPCTSTLCSTSPCTSCTAIVQVGSNPPGTDTNLPGSVNAVVISVGKFQTGYGTRTIQASVDYARE